ncbi:hypothetical protein FOFC_03531, partial [Fusarium oxysporum]
MNQTDAGLNFTPVRNDSPAASMNFPPATLGSSVTNDADLQCLTTRPGIDPPTQHRASLFPLARPRALGNIILQIEEIDELFNIVSIGCGLPLFFQMYESPSASQFESSPAESPFYLRLQIERFKLRVSLSLARPVPAGAEGALTRERSTMYHLLNSDLDELEKRFSGSSDIEDWYLMAARLHLQAFYLFDHHAMEGYKNRIVALFSTAYNLVDLSQRLNERPQGLFDYYPFFCYQTYVNAAFVLLKILTNGFFNTIIDAKAGKQLLESSITGLRQMSVVNNDLPARLGDIIGFFCALPDPA